ncbi:hypothetical protein G7Y89_g3724 [Cudoniella acicularis]|uniref:BTB domain-containing protein n=1 Tax=Cudoniella acicularis TaxID=354080 RepID=A0A8H4RSV4_9HELO|nr:hypothetical protein G7Y89_g3724 [Cudoniella acicularis]
MTLTRAGGDTTTAQSPSSSSTTSYSPRTKHKQPAPNFSLVTFLVDPEGKEFKVHREFAVYHSPVLSAAFNSDLIEGQTQTYRLPEVSPGAFTLFVQFIYRGNVIAFPILPKIDGETESEIKRRRDDLRISGERNLVELWVLAEKLLMPPLQNHVMDVLVHKKLLPTHCISYIYENTSVNSGLRIYLSSQVACFLLPKDIQRLPDDLPVQFWKDISSAHGHYIRSIGAGIWIDLKLLKVEEKVMEPLEEKLEDQKTFRKEVDRQGEIADEIWIM